MPRGPQTIKEMLKTLDLKESWESFFGTPDRVKDWYFTGYCYVDLINYMFPAKEVLKDWSLHEKILEEVCIELKNIGWDGEGVFQIFWLPPFLGFGDDSTGCFGLQVKQDNDGISWIACPQKLPILDPYDQNVTIFKEFKKRGISEGRITIEWCFSKEEHSEHLNQEKHMYTWCLENYLNLSSSEAQKKSETLYLDKTEEQQIVLFNLGAWHLAMLEIKGTHYLRDFPEFAKETSEYMKEFESFYFNRKK